MCQCIHDKATQLPEAIKEQRGKCSGIHVQLFPKKKMLDKTWKRSWDYLSVNIRQVGMPKFES